MWLTIRTGEVRGTSVEVDGEKFLLGRDDDCDLVLPGDPKISRRHACLERLPGGGARVRDLGSTNGMLVNGERVDSAVLTGLEQIQLGDTVLLASREAPGSNGTALGAATVAGARSQSAIHRLLERSTRRATILGVAAFAIALVVAGLFGTGVLPPGNGGREAVQKVVARAAPSTVLIEAERRGQHAETGTGWVLDGEPPLVVTNFHVVNGGSTFRVGTGEDFYAAEVLGAAPCEDIAVLRLEGARALRPLRLGNQASLEQGETVVALGYPANASEEAALTSTTGVVSIVQSAYREPALDVPRYSNVIQTDAAINPGDSGGPLLDLDGRMVGMSAAGRTLSPDGRIIQGQSYAIGIDQVKAVVRILRAGHSIGWSGLSFDYSADRNPAGLLVAESVSGAIRPGALLLAANGVRIGNSLAGYCDAVSGISSGEKATFTVLEPGASSPTNVLVAMK